MMPTYDELIALFEREEEVHLDIENSMEERIGVPRFQPFRLHNGKQDPDWREFYSGKLETTLDEEHGEIVYVNEIAATLLTRSRWSLGSELASVTEFKSLCAGLKK